jgi:diaminopimelate decarboxylase
MAYKSEGKPKMQLLDPDFLAEIAKALEVGDEKHRNHHYTDGVSVSEVLGAVTRHVLELYKGNLDHETEIHIAGHAAAGLQIVFRILSDPALVEFDDRSSSRVGGKMGGLDVPQ